MGRGQQGVTTAAVRRPAPKQSTVRPKGIFWATEPHFRWDEFDIDYPRPLPESYPTALSFPADSLLIIAGMPGTGKTTFMKSFLPGTPTLSIDGLQDELRRRWKKKVSLGTAADKTPERLREMMEVDGPVALEITGLRWRHRHLFQRLAADAGRPCHIVFLDIDPEVCRERQHERGYVIDEDKMKLYAESWLDIKRNLSDEDEELAFEGAHLEDYASVSVLGPEAVESLREVRFRPSR